MSKIISDSSLLASQISQITSPQNQQGQVQGQKAKSHSEPESLSFSKFTIKSNTSQLQSMISSAKQKSESQKSALGISLLSQVKEMVLGKSYANYSAPGSPEKQQAWENLLRCAEAADKASKEFSQHPASIFKSNPIIPEAMEILTKFTTAQHDLSGAISKFIKTSGMADCSKLIGLQQNAQLRASEAINFAASSMSVAAAKDPTTKASFEVRSYGMFDAPKIKSETLGGAMSEISLSMHQNNTHLQRLNSQMQGYFKELDFLEQNKGHMKHDEFVSKVTDIRAELAMAKTQIAEMTNPREGLVADKSLYEPLAEMLTRAESRLTSLFYANPRDNIINNLKALLPKIDMQLFAKPTLPTSETVVPKSQEISQESLEKTVVMTQAEIDRKENGEDLERTILVNNDLESSVIMPQSEIDVDLERSVITSQSDLDGQESSPLESTLTVDDDFGTSFSIDEEVIEDSSPLEQSPIQEDETAKAALEKKEKDMESLQGIAEAYNAKVDLLLRQLSNPQLSDEDFEKLLLEQFSEVKSAIRNSQAQSLLTDINDTQLSQGLKLLVEQSDQLNSDEKMLLEGMLRKADDRGHERGEYIQAALDHNVSIQGMVEAYLRNIPAEFYNFNVSDSTLLKAESLGSGQVNSVKLLSYGGLEAESASFVFKDEISALRGYNGVAFIFLGHNNSTSVGAVNIANNIVAKMMGAQGVIPQSSVGIHDGQFGLFMSKAPGKTAEQLINKGITLADGTNINLGALAFRLDSSLVKTMRANLMRELNKLEWLDVITGQQDRHAANYLVDINPQNGEVVVTGIDNDFSFAEAKVGMTSFDVNKITGKAKELISKEFADSIDENGIIDTAQLSETQLERFKYILNIRQVQTPQCIDQEMYEYLVSIDVGSFKKELSELLSPASVDAAVSRLLDAQEHAQKLKREGKVIASDDWQNQASKQPTQMGVDYARQSFLQRDFAMLIGKNFENAVSDDFEDSIDDIDDDLDSTDSIDDTYSLDDDYQDSPQTEIPPYGSV